MKIEIKNRFFGGIIFSIEAENWKVAVEAATKSGANLSEADLSGADLSGANLSRANLSEADLSRANLSRANLYGADLSEKQLTQFRDDLWAVLCAAPSEVQGLRQALVDGKVDGSTYTGDCACLVGTIANVAKTRYDKLPVLKPNSRRSAEIFFTLIKKDDTPKNSAWSKMAIKWIDEWLERMTNAFSEVKK